MKAVMCLPIAPSCNSLQGWDRHIIKCLNRPDALLKRTDLVWWSLCNWQVTISIVLINWDSISSLISVTTHLSFGSLQLRLSPEQLVLPGKAKCPHTSPVSQWCFCGSPSH